MNDLKYAHAFGVLESAVHRALLAVEHAIESPCMMGASDIDDICETANILKGALRDLQELGIELHDDVKEINRGR